MAIQRDATPHILVCDDEKNMRGLMRDLMEEEGWRVTTCSNGAEALEALRSPGASYDVSLVDLAMPEVDGFEVVKAIRREGIDTNVIVVTAHGTVQSTVHLMREGASDLIEKPFKNHILKAAVRQCIESRALLAQVEMAHPEFRGADGSPLEFIGGDKRLRGIFNIIRRIADLDTSVLIQGESGTGKELVAQAIHYNGVRRGQSFVAINCAALPEHLLESEMFGHERGAFTGAHALRRGKFELADGGTLFLDEVGEMPLSLQVKFLRVIQERRFMRVGGEREINVDVRIIAAANRDLAEAVAQKSFREDLYYRLNVIPIHLPPLRERTNDIPQFVRFFNNRFSARHRLPLLDLDGELLEAVSEHPWPGNIRELQNAVETAVILQDPWVIRTPALAFGAPSHKPPSPAPASPSAGATPPTPADLSEDLLSIDLGAEGEIRDLNDVAADAQRAALVRALRLCDGNKAEAAKRLGVSYRTLYNKIQELGIQISTRVK